MENTEPMDFMKEAKDLMDAERLLTARLVDSVLRTNQMASLATPEMHDMFHQWLALIGEQVLRGVSEKGGCDIPVFAKEIGISETTLFSLLAYLHRSGRIRVGSVSFLPPEGQGHEACSCLRE